MRSVGRLRIDAAAELLRLEYEKSRLSALRGSLASGLNQAEQDLKTAESRIAWVLGRLGPDPLPASGGDRRRPAKITAEQRLARVLDALGASTGTTP